MTRERDQEQLRRDALTAFLDEREREGYRVESHTHTQAIIGPPDRRRTLRRLLRKPGSLPRQASRSIVTARCPQARPNSCAPDPFEMFTSTSGGSRPADPPYSWRSIGRSRPTTAIVSCWRLRSSSTTTTLARIFNLRTPSRRSSQVLTVRRRSTPVRRGGGVLPTGRKQRTTFPNARAGDGDLSGGVERRRFVGRAMRDLVLPRRALSAGMVRWGASRDSVPAAGLVVQGRVRRHSFRQVRRRT